MTELKEKIKEILSKYQFNQEQALSEIMALVEAEIREARK